MSEPRNLWREICEAYDRSPWEVRYEPLNETVHVYPGRGPGNAPGIYVRPPNLIERALGITFEGKVTRAARRVQRTVDRLERRRIAELRNKEMLARMREEGRLP